ncbi:MAG TPA: FG-GAP-like repeat-containing protein [Candidatus Angelobacter sp.]|nr:FG-GAP-like repeat-containing protein [Candidatus Angelobacter sp.]
MRLLVLGMLLLFQSPNTTGVRDRLWQHRNLGKAYYENPMTQMKAVDEFRETLKLAPNSTRDRVNYGLALLRAGNTKDAMVELVIAQKQDPTIPHTWFNLGIAYKKDFDYIHATEQLEGMLKLVPNEPVTHYNLGIAYKLTNKPSLALQHFIAASELDPRFAAPHFQLYNAYREAGRKEDSMREMDLFNEIKKRKAGAAVAEDPEWSYYSEIYDSVEFEGESDSAASGQFKFQSRKVASGISPATAGMAVLDFDGDGQPDLIAWSENGIVLLKNGVTPVANSGLEGIRGVISISPGDFNNDGLPDLAVLTKTGAALYGNRGGRFEPLLSKMPAGIYTKAIWLDYDHDYDLDLILLGEKSVLLRNEGPAGFSDQTATFPFAAGKAIDGVSFDLVPDNGETDLAILYADGSTIIYRDKLLAHFEVQLVIAGAGPAASIQAFDINNDGWTDLVLTTANGIRLLMNDHGKLSASGTPLPAKGPVVVADLANRALADLATAGVVYRNLGAAKFDPVSVELLANSAVLAQADFDGDGRPDLVAVEPDGSLNFLKNVTATSNNYLQVRLEGIKNLKQANAAIVEVKTGAWYQKRTYSGTPLVFGLRAYPQVDTVRITWPNGLIQNETRQPVGKALEFKEKARLSGSCPMVFVWNGKRFEFVTDVLGVAPLGASSGDGQYFPVNHREHVWLPSNATQPNQDYYKVRITEELKEVTYLDQVRLVAVDHKADEEIFTSDKFTAPPFPRFRTYGVKRKIHAVRASDDNGHDVRDRLRRQDQQYVDTFPCSAAGTSSLHSLTLDFGYAAAENRNILVLQGWVDWADGSTFVGAGQQSKAGLVFPHLQVEDASGNWQTVIEDMGMPSGKPKAIVVDLTNKFLSRSRKVRIVTNLCVYWDEIFLSEESNRPDTRMTSVFPASAGLRYRGFSRMLAGVQRAQPEQFEYAAWSAQSMWNPTPGLYTRYGDVRTLLHRVDDEMVIMGSGDELILDFDLRRLPPLASGWKRDYLLSVDGWAKDSDPNTAYSNSVTPLPFHAMSSYPYPSQEHYPADPAHQHYLKQYNTRPAFPDLESLRDQPFQSQSAHNK